MNSAPAGKEDCVKFEILWCTCLFYSTGMLFGAEQPHGQHDEWLQLDVEWREKPIALFGEQVQEHNADLEQKDAKQSELERKSEVKEEPAAEGLENGSGLFACIAAQSEVDAQRCVCVRCIAAKKALALKVNAASMARVVRDVSVDAVHNAQGVFAGGLRTVRSVLGVIRDVGSDVVEAVEARMQPRDSYQEHYRHRR